nr:MAG TPA: hypothetical protein [Caudoviricetes sp.]
MSIFFMIYGNQKKINGIKNKKYGKPLTCKGG